MNPEVLNFNLSVDGDYERFIGDLRARLADHPKRLEYIARYGKWLRDHPLLPEQRRPEQPARWIHINLTVQDEDDMEETRTTIAVRDDNVYFIGFKNRNEKWYEFGFEETNRHFIAGSTFLRCDLTYRDLVGDSGNLVQLNLTKYDAIRAVRTLSGYQQAVPPDEETRHHLACICVMICESARMTPHYNTVRVGWNNNHGSRINRQVAGYTSNWSKMSRNLLSNLDPSQERNNLLAVVHLLLNSPKGVKKETQKHQQEHSSATPGAGESSQQQGQGSSNPEMSSSSGPATSSSGGGGGGTQEQGRTVGKSVSGRPLLEVFSVMIFRDAAVAVDTIVVYDGKRGQIIYKHGRHPSLPQASYYLYEPLHLSGPYKAISAEGSFAIQVCGITSGTDASDESSKVMGEIFWDCYAKDVVYNQFLTRDIISTGTGGQHTLAEVKYAVLSDAVEATIEVSLLLPGSTHVYGEIRASYVPILDYPGIVLFSREQESKVGLVPSGADSMVPLELLRSVIAVPVLTRYSWVRIYVRLYAATPNSQSDVPLIGDIFFYLDKHTGEIRIDQYEDIFVPVGWTGGSDPKGAGASHGSQGASSSPSRQGTEETSEQQVKVQVNITSPGFHLSPLKPESLDHMGM